MRIPKKNGEMIKFLIGVAAIVTFVAAAIISICVLGTDPEIGFPDWEFRAVIIFELITKSLLVGSAGGIVYSFYALISAVALIVPVLLTFAIGYLLGLVLKYI